MQSDDCQTCWGCGKVVRERKGLVSYQAWLTLPLASSAALLSGIVRPEMCPDCFGVGKSIATLKARYMDMSLAKLTVFDACICCRGLGFIHLAPVVHGRDLDPVLGKAYKTCPECKLTEAQVEGLHSAICGATCSFMHGAGTV